MKILRSYLFQTLLFVMAVLCMNSCSCRSKVSTEAKIDYLVSESTDVAVVLDIERLFDQMDIKIEKDGSLVLPEYLDKLVNMTMGRSQRNGLERLLKFKGIGHNSVLFTMSGSLADPTCAVVIDITDVKDFVRFCAENDIDVKKSESDGLTVLTYNNTSIVVKDGMGVLMFDKKGELKSSQTIENVKKFAAEAKAAPIAEWKKKELLEGKVLTGVVSLDMIRKTDPRAWSRVVEQCKNYGMNIEGSTVAAAFDLDGATAKLHAALYDTNGDKIENPFFTTIDKDLLAYASADDVFAFGMSMSKMKDVLKQQLIGELSADADIVGAEYAQQLKVAEAVIGTIVDSLEGNVIFAAGPAEGATLLGTDWNSASAYHFVIAANCTKGNGAAMLDLVQAAVANVKIPGATLNRTSNGFDTEIEIDREYDWMTDTYTPKTMHLYVALQDDVLVLSNSPAKKGGKNIFDTSMFADSNMACQFRVDKNMPLLSSLNMSFGFNVTAQSGKTDGEAQLTLTDCKENVIPALVGLITNFSR